MKRLLLLLSLLLPLYALAQPAAIVEGVQSPAWVERDGRRIPLQPGMELRAGDRVFTGQGSRALFKLAEGSLVKLGENGNLNFTTLSPTQEVFRAAMRVLEGAFRFTTDVAAKQRRRDVNITVATVTAGIRGTDLWGRSREDTQIVCLIEGEIEVGAEGEKPVVMNQPLQFYQRVKGQTQPVGLVDPKQLAQWATETEFVPGRPSTRRGGRFAAQLAAVDSQNEALAVYDRARDAGYPAEIAPARDGDKIRYVVRIRNLPSKAEADALVAELKTRI
ncbi:MAG TPA: FecR domain-containing protein [Burkholderiales bacterium]|nr:FecR domain-containing protein [Burkholderiales bacterium]